MKRITTKLNVFFLVAITIFFLITTTNSFADAISVYQGTWDTQANSTEFLNGAAGQKYTISFPGNGTNNGRLWGTDIYTDDSSIAAAAVHAGLITLQDGGVVTIEIRPGQSTYTATTRNGIESYYYGDWPRSFAFVSSTGCRVTPKSLSINITGIPSVSSPVQFTADAVSECGGQIYYRYAYHADYGSDAYNDPSAWVVMSQPEFTTNKTINYTFPSAGNYVVVVWTTPSMAAPSTIPLIGSSISIDN